VVEGRPTLESVENEIGHAEAEGIFGEAASSAEASTNLRDYTERIHYASLSARDHVSLLDSLCYCSTWQQHTTLLFRDVG